MAPTAAGHSNLELGTGRSVYLLGLLIVTAVCSLGIVGSNHPDRLKRLWLAIARRWRGGSGANQPPSGNHPRSRGHMPHAHKKGLRAATVRVTDFMALIALANALVGFIGNRS